MTENTELELATYLDWEAVRRTIRQYVRGELNQLDVSEHGHLNEAKCADDEKYKQIQMEERTKAFKEGEYVKGR